MIKTLLLILSVCAVMLIFIYFYQRHLLYFPDKRTVTPQASQALDMYEVKLHTDDGLDLIAWYSPAKNGQRTIIYLHGNAGNIAIRVPLIRPFITQGYGVLLVEYRGYAQNPGRPSEQGLYHDGRAAIRFLMDKGMSLDCIILFGESLGSSVAIQLATQYNVAGIILQSPASSIVAIGRRIYPFLPVSLLLRDRYETITIINKVKSPLLILASRKDELIPVTDSIELFEAANQPKQIHILEDHALSHNYLTNEEFYKTVNNFLQKIPAAKNC